MGRIALSTCDSGTPGGAEMRVVTLDGKALAVKVEEALGQPTSALCLSKSYGTNLRLRGRVLTRSSVEALLTF